jgi:hypothetical protein
MRQLRRDCDTVWLLASPITVLGWAVLGDTYSKERTGSDILIAVTLGPPAQRDEDRLQQRPRRSTCRVV